MKGVGDMGEFIGVSLIDVAEVEEGDEVQITVTYDDGAVHVLTGRVRRVDSAWGDGTELSVGPVCLERIPQALSVESYIIELLRRDEKHGYHVAALKDSLSREIYLWKYDGEWKIVQCAGDKGFVTEGSVADGPSEFRRFIGTDL